MAIPPEIRKKSAMISHIVLTSNQFHGAYDTAIFGWMKDPLKDPGVAAEGTARMKSVLSAFLELISMTGSGKRGYITESDIKRVLAQPKYDNIKDLNLFESYWKNNPKTKDLPFSDRLEEFNKRRVLIKTQGVFEFLDTKYHTVIKRYSGENFIDWINSLVFTDLSAPLFSYEKEGELFQKYMESKYLGDLVEAGRW